MNSCVNCRRKTNNPRFCSRSCSVSYHNRLNPKRGRCPDHPCEYCEQVTKNSRFCSHRCHKQWQYEDFIQRWKIGLVIGGNEGGVSEYVRRYLRETRGERCEKCGWAERHPELGYVPLEIHHIGAHDDHTEENLQQLCPNDHSLTSNYRNLNAGNGRPGRRHGAEA